MRPFYFDDYQRHYYRNYSKIKSKENDSIEIVFFSFGNEIVYSNITLILIAKKLHTGNQCEQNVKM